MIHYGGRNPFLETPTYAAQNTTDGISLPFVTSASFCSSPRLSAARNAASLNSETSTPKTVFGGQKH